MKYECFAEFQWFKISMLIPADVRWNLGYTCLLPASSLYNKKKSNHLPLWYITGLMYCEVWPFCRKYPCKYQPDTQISYADAILLIVKALPCFIVSDMFLFQMGVAWCHGPGWLLSSAELHRIRSCHVFYLQCVPRMLGTNWRALVRTWATLPNLPIREGGVHTKCTCSCELLYRTCTAPFLQRK